MKTRIYAAPAVKGFIEGLVYESHTKSIHSARASGFVDIHFASYPNVFGACTCELRKKHCIHDMCIVVKWIANCYFLLQFMHAFGFICFVQGAIDMC